MTWRKSAAVIDTRRPKRRQQRAGHLTSRCATRTRCAPRRCARRRAGARRCRGAGERTRAQDRARAERGGDRLALRAGDALHGGRAPRPLPPRSRRRSRPVRSRCRRAWCSPWRSARRGAKLGAVAQRHEGRGHDDRATAAGGPGPRDLLALTPEAPVLEAIRAMAEHRVGALLVMSGRGPGRHRLGARLRAQGDPARARLADTPVRDIMSSAVITVTPEDTVQITACSS